MEIEQVVSQYKDTYSLLLKYITSDGETETYHEYQQLINTIDTFIRENNHHRLQELLLILSNISRNHQFTQDLFIKVTKILLYLKDYLKQTFTNFEIFDKFKKDKRILLYLFKSEIIIPDDLIFDFIYSEQTAKNNRFHYDVFFYPEMKKFISMKAQNEVQRDLSEYESSITDNFESNREKGENESYICELIRSDSIEEFVQYLNKRSISHDSTISPSIFECNPLLIKKDPTLIEYAAFYGSIQIFKYLKFNKTDFEENGSLWIYTIHGNNPEIIQILEDNKVSPPKGSFKYCLKEAVKCHHNEMATYFICNLMSKNDVYDVEHNFETNVSNYCYRYHNFQFYQNDLEDKYAFLYLCKYDYVKLIKLYLKYKDIDINFNVV